MTSPHVELDERMHRRYARYQSAVARIQKTYQDFAFNARWDETRRPNTDRHRDLFRSLDALRAIARYETVRARFAPLAGNTGIRRLDERLLAGGGVGHQEWCATLLYRLRHGDSPYHQYFEDLTKRDQLKAELVGCFADRSLELELTADSPLREDLNVVADFTSDTQLRARLLPEAKIAANPPQVTEAIDTATLQSIVIAAFIVRANETQFARAERRLDVIAETEFDLLSGQFLLMDFPAVGVPPKFWVNSPTQMGENAYLRSVSGPVDRGLAL